jgi:hypothetical protein
MKAEEKECRVESGRGKRGRQKRGKKKHHMSKETFKDNEIL